MKRQLESIGYGVDTVNSAEEAEVVLQRNRFDLVITDVVLKRGTGELVSRMVDRYNPGTPVLFMSGYVDLLMMSGARVLEKPYSSQMLTQAIKEAMGEEPEGNEERKTK